MYQPRSILGTLLCLSATVILQPAFSQDQSEIARTNLSAVRIFLNTIDLGPPLLISMGMCRLESKI